MEQHEQHDSLPVSASGSLHTVWCPLLLAGSPKHSTKHIVWCLIYGCIVYGGGFHAPGYLYLSLAAVLLHPTRELSPSNLWKKMKLQARSRKRRK